MLISINRDVGYRGRALDDFYAFPREQMRIGQGAVFINQNLNE